VVEVAAMTAAQAELAAAADILKLVFLSTTEM
jgi:hypothetical protein